MSTTGRRAPPGGASTFSFGDYDESKENQATDKQSSDHKSTNGVTRQAGSQQGGLPPAVQKQVASLMSNTTDVNDLIKKLQSFAGVGSQQQQQQTTGGDSSADRGLQPASGKVEAAQKALRQALAKRGCDTLLTVSKKFKIMDDDHDGGISFGEFKKGLAESGMELQESELHALFRGFDTDCSGYLNFDEFLNGVRPPLNGKRQALVTEAFETMDANGDGALTVDEMAERYDASVHPDVASGAHSSNEIMQNFLANFDGTLGPKSAIVTKEKLLAYYANVSAAIDDDEYFELMVRNVWHLPGSGNTTARRLLVTHEDGTQTVEVLDGDMDVGRDDLRAIKENLREQGMPVVKVALYGYVESGDHLITSLSSPRKEGSVASGGAFGGGSDKPAGRKSAGGGADEAADPDEAAKSYKARMSHSSVSFA